MYFMNAYVNVHGIRAQHYFAITIYSSESIRFWNSAMNNMYIMENFVIFFHLKLLLLFFEIFCSYMKYPCFCATDFLEFLMYFFDYHDVSIVSTMWMQTYKWKSLFPISKWFFNMRHRCFYLSLDDPIIIIITFSSHTNRPISLIENYLPLDTSDWKHLFHPQKNHFQIKMLIG